MCGLRCKIFRQVVQKNRRLAAENCINTGTIIFAAQIAFTFDQGKSKSNNSMRLQKTASSCLFSFKKLRLQCSTGTSVCQEIFVKKFTIPYIFIHKASGKTLIYNKSKGDRLPFPKHCAAQACQRARRIFWRTGRRR